jgi:two-component system response regulator MprA
VTNNPGKAVEVFYSYAPSDVRLRNQLSKHLSNLKRQGLITGWHDRDISAGADWETMVDTHLNSAQIILLLISPDFMASDYCYSKEMKRALERHEAGEARVIPIVLRSVLWEGAPFGKLRFLPSNGKPVTSRSWHNKDEAFLDITRGIHKVVEEIRSKYETVPHVQEVHSFLPSSFPAPIANTSQTPNHLANVSLPREEDQQRLHILIVDDDKHIFDFLRLGFRYEGFRVSYLEYGEDAVDYIHKYKPDLVILDFMLIGIDGIEVCRRIRFDNAIRDIPILMLTAKDEVADRIMGLNTGADDYLTKPFDFDELLAHIQAILRRSQRYKLRSVDLTDEEKDLLIFGNLVLNTRNHELTKEGQKIDLTATEYNLLHLLMTHPKQVLDRQTILNRVWGYDFLGETNIIEVYIRYLREKIEDNPSSPRFIQTVRSVGYVLKG